MLERHVHLGCHSLGTHRRWTHRRPPGITPDLPCIRTGPVPSSTDPGRQERLRGLRPVPESREWSLANRSPSLTGLRLSSRRTGAFSNRWSHLWRRSLYGALPAGEHKSTRKTVKSPFPFIQQSVPHDTGPGPVSPSGGTSPVLLRVLSRGRASQDRRVNT